MRTIYIDNLFNPLLQPDAACVVVHNRNKCSGDYLVQDGTSKLMSGLYREAYKTCREKDLARHTAEYLQRVHS